MVLSLLEKLLLLALIVASVGVFLARFSKVAKIIAAAKPDSGLVLSDLPRRFANFIREVLLQAKVIKQRPIAGAAHALVFWGFLAFALITLNHFALGFGFPFLSRENVFGRVYMGFVAVVAVSVIVGIVYLGFRRFILRPRWLGKVSPESGIIALLITVLMVTYLAGLVLDESRLAGHLVWWTHTLALLIFLPLVPHTKHL